MGIVLYAPAIAIEGLTGVPEWATVIVCGVLTTIYTVKGGMSSVIITDFMQSLVLVAGAVACLGICAARTPAGALSSASAWRLGGFFEFDPFRETTFWSVVVGNWFQSVAQGGCNQIAVQRYMACGDLKSMQRTAMLGWLLNAAFTVILTTLGIALYAFYAANPPTLSTPDEILPYFISHALPEGVRGLLIAAILGCTMSVCSAGLNSATTVISIDVLQNVCGFASDDASVVKTAKILTLASGVVAISTGLLCMQLGDSLIKLNQVFLGMTSGPVLGTFLLGMLTARANARGVLVSFACSAMLIVYFGAGSLYCSASAHDDGCAGGWLKPCTMSNFWFNPMLCAFTIAVGFLASGAFEGKRIDASRLTLFKSKSSESMQTLL